MTIHGCATADAGDLSMFDALLVSADYELTVSASVARTGSKSFRSGVSANAGEAKSGNAYGIFNVPANNEQYVGVAIYPRSGQYGVPFVSPAKITLAAFYEGGTLHCQIVYNSENSTINVYRTSATWLASAGAIPTDTWTYLEIYVKTANAPNGAVTVKFNGNVALTATALDTQVGATGVCNVVAVGWVPFGLFAGDYSRPEHWLYLDDIVVADAWPGKNGLYIMPATQDGTDTAWTSSSGDRWNAVNELPPDFTKYIYTAGSVAGTKNTVGVGILPITTETISFVGVYAQGKLDAAGSATVRAIANSSGSYSSGSNLSLGTEAAYSKHLMLLNPNGDVAWTQTAVEALNIGAETQ